MDNFTHTREHCKNIIEKKQIELLSISRKSVYDQIHLDVQNSNGNICINLDSRLDNIRKKQLIGELLDCFKTLILIKNTYNQPNFETVISEKNEIIDDITGIRIIL